MIFSIFFGSSWLVTAEHEDDIICVLEIRDHRTNLALDLESSLNELERKEQTHLLTGKLAAEYRARMASRESDEDADGNVDAGTRADEYSHTAARYV